MVRVPKLPLSSTAVVSCTPSVSLLWGSVMKVGISLVASSPRPARILGRAGLRSKRPGDPYEIPDATTEDRRMVSPGGSRIELFVLSVDTGRPREQRSRGRRGQRR